MHCYCASNGYAPMVSGCKITAYLPMYQLFSLFFSILFGE